MSATRSRAELLQFLREMKAGYVRVVSSPVIEACKKTGLSESQLAALFGAGLSLAMEIARPQTLSLI